MKKSIRHMALAALISPLLWLGSAQAQPAAAPLSEGEVRRVDLAQGKVTLRHGPLANLEMPPMTMVFTATDPRLLEGLKEGDKVRFSADKVDGRYVVTVIQRP